MKLINNGIREIKGFTQDELLEIKRKLAIFKADKSGMDDYLQSKFPSEILNFYSEYNEDIRSFIEEFLMSNEVAPGNSGYIYHHLKTGILKELKLISNNLLNLKLNGRNIKRFVKESDFLNNNLEIIQKILDDFSELIPKIENSLTPFNGIYDDIGYLWFEVNKIKNLIFRFKNLPDKLEKWEEIKNLYIDAENAYLRILNKKRLKKDDLLTAHFKDIHQFCIQRDSDNIKFYSDLVFFLNHINILEETDKVDKDFAEFVNILDRKEIKSKIITFFQPIVESIIEDKLEAVLNEIRMLDDQFNLEDGKNKINLEKLLNQKISILLPKISDYYLDGLEKKYQQIIGNLEEYDEIKKSANLYTESVNRFNSLIESLDSSISNFEPILKPYEETIDSLRKIFENITYEILRRRDEYEYYLKTVRKEKLRDNVRNYIYEKRNDLNKLMSRYQDDVAQIVKEEFPQITQIREIFSDYKERIHEIKKDVYNKIDTFKEKDIDIYQIIKQWEDNFTLKRQQLGFLLGTLLNKLFKNFKEIIEEEELLFKNITHITDQNKSIDSLPLNFALSEILVDKLTEEELHERMKKVHSKIDDLNRELNLYQSEITNLEETIANKVKIREGITSDKIICSICRKNFDWAKDQIIKCPFCDAVYHYLCVADWLSKHNSCPSCQNAFLDPNSGIYED